MTITVYTRPGCMQCQATKRTLTRLGLTFEEVEVTETVADELKRDGFRQLPVVRAADRAWSGFRCDLLRSLAA